MGHISDYSNTQIGTKIDKRFVNQISKTVTADCVRLIVNGYNNYLSDCKINFTVDEPTISAGLYGHIEKILLSSEISCVIVPEFPDYNKNIITGRVNPKKAKRFDLCFIHLGSKPSSYFGVEAKLLLEKNSKKKNASRLVSEYVLDKGMGKFINSLYKKNGLMLGYVIAGDISNIVTLINQNIEKNYSTGNALTFHSEYPEITTPIFISNHISLKDGLLHIFLDFAKYNIEI